MPSGDEKVSTSFRATYAPIPTTPFSENQNEFLFVGVGVLMVVQGSEGVGRWNQRSVLKCSTLRSHPARGGTATHQKLEVSAKTLLSQ